MHIRRYAPLASSLLTASLVLAVVGPAPALADSRPTIVSVTLDASNHAVVTWTKEPWQGSQDVKWSAGDGAVAAPSATWDGHYGLPLTDCYGQPLDGNPYGGDQTKGQWSYGQACRGQDVANAATTATTWNALVPGVYYFQVIVAGENHETGAPCKAGSANDCYAMHYSGVSKLTVLPGSTDSPASSPTASTEPSGLTGSSAAPGPNAHEAM
ncbi:MAG: hypothetical protein ACHQNA_13825, partial [Acidimicrobiales bacterium]